MIEERSGGADTWMIRYLVLMLMDESVRIGALYYTH